MITRGISIRQPWAGLIASGIKRVENRPRRIIDRSYFGERIAIHAPKTVDKFALPAIQRSAPQLFRGVVPYGDWWRLATVTSAIVATAVVIDVFDVRERHDRERVPDAQKRFTFGPFAYLFDSIVPLESPILGVLGGLGLIQLPSDAVSALNVGALA